MTSSDNLSWLASQESELEQRQTGEMIFCEGEEGDQMYLVRSGKVAIQVNGKTIDVVEKGGIFGEMALIDSAPRSATALAETECSILPIDERKFVFLVHETPFFALDVMRTLAKRLRSMNQLV